MVEGCSAKAARRDVDDTLKTDAVLWLINQPHVGQQVFDFLAVVKALPADDAVGNAVANESFLDGAALGIGPVQHGKVAVAPCANVHAATDAPHNRLTL